MAAHVFPGVLESPEDFDNEDELFDAVGSVLLESLGFADQEEDKVREVCSQLYAILCGGGGGTADSGDSDCQDAAIAKRLDAPVHLASKLKDEGTLLTVHEIKVTSCICR